MESKYTGISNYVRSLLVSVVCIFLTLCTQHLLASGLIINKANGKIKADSTLFNINGRVVDEAGAPVPGATVFISNSKWAAATADDGMFKISGVPAGNYELLVRMMGYVTSARNISITNRSVTINIALKPDAVILNEAKITAKPDGSRARYLEMFTEAFLGDSPFGKKSKIINSDVLRFHYLKDAGTLTASSTDFIKVENAALGYNVYYLLNSFSFNQQRLTYAYEGKIYFEELKGDDKKEKEWSQNRKVAYNGSMRHFFRALYKGTTEAEGFKIYKIADSELGRNSKFNTPGTARTGGLMINLVNIDRANLTPVKPESLYKLKDINKVLQVPLLVNDGDTTRFYFCYTRRHEPSNFLNSGAHLNIPIPNAQISALRQLGNNNVIINKNGSLTRQQDVLVEGFWGWQRVGDVLPEELTPQMEANKPVESEPLSQIEPLEKIHMQLDRPWYFTGDTAWMKVYVVDAHNKPSADSKICFVELIDRNKHIVKNLRLPLNTGITWGEMALSDSLLKNGTYILRAYTNNTLKNNNNFFYRTLTIANPRAAAIKLNGAGAVTKQHALPDSISLQFFPEGGTLITDVTTKTAISVSSLGKPVKGMSGYVINNEGSHVAKFETNKSGVSAFNLKPLKQAKYWAVLALPNGQEKRLAMPQAQSSGVGMAVKQNDDDVIIYLNSPDLNEQIPLTLAAKARGKIQYLAKKLLANTVDSMVISKSELPAGIQHFYLYANGAVISERTIYNQNNRHLNVQLATDKPVYKLHDKVEIKIAITDGDNKPVSGNYSVSVNNEADMAENDETESILSDLLLGRDLNDSKRMVNYNPSNLNSATQRELDEMLLTVKSQNGTKQLSDQKSTFGQQQDIPFALSGHVYRSKDKPAALAVVGLFFPTGGPAVTTVADNNGRFVFDSLPVKRGEPFYAVAKDNKKDLLVSIDRYEPPAIADEILADTLKSDDTNTLIDDIAKRIAALKTDNILGTELTEVLINVKKKAEPTIKDLVKHRSSNMGGTPDQVITFIDLLGCNNGSLGECLALQLNGIIVSIDTFHNISLTARGRNTQPMAVFVDGVERSDALRTLSTAVVSSVEVLKGSNAAAYGIRGGNGVIVITTKGGELDYEAYKQEYVPGSTKTSPIQRYKFENGADEPRSFYAPDYTKISANIIDKWRPTIYWDPNVTTDADGKAQLSYFTNNAPGTYRVTIEGLDSYGRIARQVFNYAVSE